MFLPKMTHRLWGARRRQSTSFECTTGTAEFCFWLSRFSGTICTCRIQVPVSGNATCFHSVRSGSASFRAWLAISRGYTERRTLFMHAQERWSRGFYFVTLKWFKCATLGSLLCRLNQSSDVTIDFQQLVHSTARREEHSTRYYKT